VLLAEYASAWPNRAQNLRMFRLTMRIGSSKMSARRLSPSTPHSALQWHFR
jgi:hypothetical protein